MFYYHADGEGSIRLLTDANAQIANRYDYDSFGKPLTVVEAVAQPYTWKAREYISGAGLYYNRARFYDPQLGRFTTEDPWGYGGGDTNLFAHVLNNPKRWNDPSGLVGESGFLASNSSKVSIGLGLTGLALACVFTDISDYIRAALPSIPSDLVAIASNSICGAAQAGKGAGGGKGGKNNISAGGGDPGGPGSGPNRPPYWRSNTVDGKTGRPYNQSDLTVNEVKNSGPGRPDPGGTGGTRWDVPGTFNGKPGIWELVIDGSGRIIHWLFRPGK